MEPRLRPLEPGDAPAVRRIFASTMVLGSPAPLPARELDAYARLCLGWYLEHLDDSVVVVEDGHVRGYLLACLDQADHDRWISRAAVRWAAAALGRVASGRARGDSRRFVLLRVRDGLSTLAAAVPPPFPAHAHVNLDPDLRGRAVGHQLILAMDDRVRAAGLDGWFGEMVWPAGRSTSAVDAAGAEVTGRAPSRTLSWLAGRPVERATVARPLAAATGAARDRVSGTTHA